MLTWIFLIPQAIQLIFALERLIKGRGSGQEKKDQAMEALKRMVGLLASIGVIAPDRREAIESALGELVDVIVGFLNDKGVFSHG